jgi:hypothetical protein
VKHNFFYEIIHAKDIGFEHNCFDIIVPSLMRYRVQNKKRSYQKLGEHRKRVAHSSRQHTAPGTCWN